MSAETFGAMLRRLRCEAGLSQNALGKAAKIDAAYLNRMERSGERTVSGLLLPAVSPSRDTALALAGALRLDSIATDRFLFAAGLATELDWQTRCLLAESKLARMRDILTDDGQQPAFIRSRVG